MNIWMDVDVALAEVPVNLMPLIDDTDFKTREVSVAHNAAGMDLVWNFVATGGTFTQTAVTPSNSGDYLWTNQGDALYTIQIPASGGASINNDTEGFGWFSGVATGILPWRGPVIGFRAAALNDALINGTLTAFLNQIADTTLKRDWTAINLTGLPARCALNALRFLRNAWALVAGTPSVLKVAGEDDNTASPAWSKEVSQNAASEPITGTGDDV